MSEPGFTGLRDLQDEPEPEPENPGSSVNPDIRVQTDRNESGVTALPKYGLSMLPEQLQDLQTGEFLLSLR